MGVAEGDIVDEAQAPEEWEEVRAFLLEHADLVRGDAELLSTLGLKHAPPNVVDFGPFALARLEAERERELTARQEIEALAQANFDAQAQTHAMILDLLEARSPEDLAERVNAASRERFGVEAVAIALDAPPAETPPGWRSLPQGLLGYIFAEDEHCLVGPSSGGREIFGDNAKAIKSVGLVRMSMWNPARQGLLAFGSTDPEGFTPDMGTELIAFLAQVVERIADRWPPQA